MELNPRKCEILITKKLKSEFGPKKQIKYLGFTMTNKWFLMPNYNLMVSKIARVSTNKVMPKRLFSYFLY